MRSFRHRNYRLFFLGQIVSLTGTWMQVVAVSWLIYSLTKSAFLLGLVGFASQLPIFLLSPFGGVLADRVNRRRILVITQALAMLQALALSFLAFNGTIAVWHMISLSAFLGLINAFDIPVRQAFVVDMVEGKEDLGNAIALNSFMFNSARLIGPTLAGVLVATMGAGVCFLINGLSFFAVIFALLAMRIKPRDIGHAGSENMLKGLKEGFIYAIKILPIRYILLLTVLISIMGMSYAFIMPIFAKDILHGGPQVFGFLMGSAGLGALLGATYLLSRKGNKGLEKIIAISTIIFGVAIIAFSFSSILWLSLAFIMIAGFGIMIQTVASNTVLQHISDDDKRGRVISFYVVAFMGMTPFGSLLAGILAGRIGAPTTLMISGIACIAGALLFLRKVSLVRESLLQGSSK